MFSHLLLSLYVNTFRGNENLIPSKPFKDYVCAHNFMKGKEFKSSINSNNEHLIKSQKNMNQLWTDRSPDQKSSGKLTNYLHLLWRIMLWSAQKQFLPH